MLQSLHLQCRSVCPGHACIKIFFNHPCQMRTYSVENHAARTTKAKALAKALFGPPDSIAQSAATVGGISEETLFYPGHQAVYSKGSLSRVVLEPGSPLGLGRWKLGQPASSCLALGEPEKQDNIWTFMIAPNEYLRFTIKDNQIAGAEYLGATTN